MTLWLHLPSRDRVADLVAQWVGAVDSVPWRPVLTRSRCVSPPQVEPLAATILPRLRFGNLVWLFSVTRASSPSIFTIPAIHLLSSRYMLGTVFSL